MNEVADVDAMAWLEGIDTGDDCPACERCGGLCDLCQLAEKLYVERVAHQECVIS